jgi:hypothetical protein
MISVLGLSLLAAALVVQWPSESMPAQPERMLLAAQKGDVDASPVPDRGRRAKTKPVAEEASPLVGSPQWQRREAEQAAYDKALNRALNNICRGC